MKNAQNNFIEGIGNTPLVKLRAAALNFTNGVLPIPSIKLF